MANIYNEPESTNVKITLKNNVYSYLNTEIGIAKICLITDQKKFGYSDLLGNLKKCLTDASGSSLTPKNCVFIADSEGSASHSTTFVYNDNKLGVNIEAPQNRAHFHEPSTGNCLIQITNASRGSSDDNDGMTIGIVGDDNVIRTTCGIPIKIQAEDPDRPGTFVDLATFQNIDSNSKNTILNTDLTVNIISEKSTAASVFLTHENNTIKTRTAAQVLDDIGAAAVNHTHSAIDLPANVVYTDNAQTITGAKTFSQATTFGGAIIGSNVNGLIITTDTVDGSDNKYVSLFGAGGNANRAAGLVAYGNEHSEGQGDLRLYAGTSGAIRLYGNTLVNGTLKANNGFVGQASAAAKHYHDVLSYSGPSDITGTMKITMPKSWSSTVMSVTIKGFSLLDHNINGWECRVHGYNTVLGRWERCSAQIIGNAPFSQVRLAHDGSKCIILLGTTETGWNYAKVAISEMLACQENTDGWETGWNASIIQSETGITNIITPRTSIYGNNAVIPNNALIGKTSTNKLNTGTFVRKTLTTTATAIDLNSETTWNFRLKTNLTSTPKVYFSNAKEGDEIFVVNVGSNPINIMAAYGSDTSEVASYLAPWEGSMLRCIGVDDSDYDYPVYAVVQHIWLPSYGLKP